ncbi:MAG: hypothetical protein M3083_22980, partial [Actinomycetota bacterium]|nr:hypothetical protein [Actinomycetota bacterium]
MSSETSADDGRWLGPNAWLVDEMYEQYRQDPASVSESWQEFFADYHHRGLVATRPEPAPGAAPGSVPPMALDVPVARTARVGPAGPAVAPPVG